MIRWSFIITVLLWSAGLSGQITTTIRTLQDSVGIGQPIELEFRISVSENCRPQSISLPASDAISNLIYDQDSVIFEKIADWVILDPGVWKNIDPSNQINWADTKYETSETGYIINNIVQIGIYNPGIFSFSPASVVCANDTEVIRGEDALIKVGLPEGFSKQDSVYLEPIRDILTEPFTMEDAMPWLYGLLVILLIMLAAWYIRRRMQLNKTSEVPREVEVVELPAHEKALASLRELKVKNLWQQGLVKEYQSELTQIIRQYIEDRYNIQALEMTTGEIAQALSHIGMESIYREKLTELLTVADMVKFAKAKPDDQVHIRFFDMATDFIEQTKITPET